MSLADRGRRRSSAAIPALAIALMAAAMAWSDGLIASNADAAPVRRITLPIHRDHVDRVYWSDTFGAPRSGGRSHIGVDMMGPKMVPLVAVRSGHITWGRFDNGRGSLLRLTDDDGWEYHYIHLNNDTPGTDDGQAECHQVFSARLCSHISSGGRFLTDVRVSEGEIIGYLGDSGNAEWTGAHLHFEVAEPGSDGGTRDLNPTPFVDAALSRLLLEPADREPPPAAAPGDDGFTDHLWYRLHGRYPTADESTAFQAAVAEDGLWEALADEIDTASPVSMIDRLYLAFFLRYPDIGGIEYWTEVRADGHALEEIAEWFAQSEEFRSRYEGSSFSAFLDQLYRDVLGREPDGEGKAYWLDQLGQGAVTRGTIVVYFTESAEMKGLAEQRSELVALTLVRDGRMPAGADIETWENLRASRDRSDAVDLWFSAERQG